MGTGVDRAFMKEIGLDLFISLGIMTDCDDESILIPQSSGGSGGFDGR